MLLCVLESERSSPGRQGFKMAVSADGEFFGTIGGGMMEQKFVEKAKHLLAENKTKVLLMRQYHDKQHSTGSMRNDMFRQPVKYFCSLINK